MTRFVSVTLSVASLTVLALSLALLCPSELPPLLAHVAPVASAAANPSGGRSLASRGGGVTISPAIQQVTISPGEPEATFNFSVSNNSDEAYEFGLSVVDFGSLDETGGVLFAGNANKTLNYRYTLSPWVELQKDRIVVDAHATEKVPITILNKESLAPGGHYGAILVTPTEVAGAADKKVDINQVASSLLFVKKLGGEVYRLGLQNISVGTHLFSLPGQLNLRFQNAGNVHVVPYGLATISDPRGTVVERGIINSDSGIILPETFRQVTLPLQPMARAWLPGRYKLTVAYHYDDSTATSTSQSSFMYLNIATLMLLLLVLAIIASLLLSGRLRRWLLAGVRMRVRRAGAVLRRWVHHRRG